MLFISCIPVFQHYIQAVNRFILSREKIPRGFSYFKFIFRLWTKQSNIGIFVIFIWTGGWGKTRSYTELFVLGAGGKLVLLQKIGSGAGGKLVPL